MKNKNTERIIYLSADLGHYIADANVPLHTTLNYDGQLTDQHGIHAFWESRLPELFHFEYNFIVPKTKYIPNVLSQIWETIEQSHNAKDTVLLFEKNLEKLLIQIKYIVLKKKQESLLRCILKNTL